MANDFVEWTTNYPASQDSDANTEQPDLENDPTGTPRAAGTGNTSRVSQIHTLRDKLHDVAKKVGDNSNLPAGSHAAKIAALESAPPAHKTSHQNGGTDEISVAGLSGELADAQTPKTHASTHSSGQSDAISHQNLSGAGTNTHTQIDSHISSVANPHSVTATQVGLSNVTNDAQLKRAAGDINSFSEKVTVVSGDYVLIEDSADSYTKKKAKAGNFPFSGGGGTDSAAVHVSTAGEIHAVAAKGTPVAADELLIEDSTDSWNKKRVALTNLLTTTDSAAIHGNVSNEIGALTEKVAVVSGDYVIVEDSADSWNKKKVKAGNIAALTMPGGGGGSGTDENAIHDNVAGEVSALSIKIPVSGDYVIIEDSEDSWSKKKVKVGDIAALTPTGGSGTASGVLIKALDHTPAGTYTTTSATFVDVNAAVTNTFDAAAAGTYQVLFDFQRIYVTGATTPHIVEFRLVIDAGTGSEQILRTHTESCNDTNGFNMVVVDQVDLTLGSHTIKPQWRRYYGSGTLNVDTSSKFYVQMALTTSSGAGSDTTAIHDDTAGEINAISAKSSPVSGDYLIIEDSADSWNKKKLKVGDVRDSNAFHIDIPNEISSLASKTSVTSGDYVVLEDCTGSYTKKKTTVTDLFSSSLGVQTNTTLVGLNNISAVASPSWAVQEVVGTEKTITVAAGDRVLCLVSAWGYSNNSGTQNNRLYLYMDNEGTENNYIQYVQTYGVQYAGNTMSFHYVTVPLSAGSHTFKLFANKYSSSFTTWNLASAILTVIRLPGG